MRIASKEVKRLYKLVPAEEIEIVDKDVQVCQWVVRVDATGSEHFPRSLS
jgi:hypothetical protein